MVPMVGAAGVAGCGLITTLADEVEIQPSELVTVNVRVPTTSPEIVVLLPLPAMLPGLMVQLPDGNPLNTTLPVASAQLGWVMVPIMGAEGVAGCGSMTTLPEEAEMQPSELVTVNVCVPVAKPEIVVLAPLPAMLPGLMVQLPDGKPFKTTLPVARAQVG